MKKILITLVAILLITIIICYINNLSNSVDVLSPIKVVSLTVPEPSGLEYDKDENVLWTVSDETSKIYKIDFEGNILKEIEVDGFDLEGITKTDDSTLVVILERSRTVVILDTSGTELNRIELNLDGEPNKGIEGIAYNPNNSNLYILNEKKPRLLMKLDSDGTVQKHSIDFALDLSGIFYEELTESLWILSDESEAIFKCNEKGSVITKYKIDIEQAEGIAINSMDSLLYVISDPLEKLFIYELP